MSLASTGGFFTTEPPEESKRGIGFAKVEDRGARVGSLNQSRMTSEGSDQGISTKVKVCVCGKEVWRG